MPAVSSLLTPATLLIKRAFGLKEALGLSRLVQGCSWIVVSRKARLRGLGGSEGLADLETGLHFIVSIELLLRHHGSMAEVSGGLFRLHPNNQSHDIPHFSKLTCFLRRMTLKRSKSLRFLLLVTCSRFLA